MGAMPVDFSLLQSSWCLFQTPLPDVEAIQVDITSPQSLQKLIFLIGFVIHMAGKIKSYLSLSAYGVTAG